MSRITTAALSMLLACCLPLLAKGGLEFSGDLSMDLMLLHDYVSDGSDEVDFGGTGRLSLGFRNVNRRYGKIEGSLDVIMLYGMTAGGADLTQVEDADLAELLSAGQMQLFSLGSAPVILDLRKLYLAFYLPFADIAIGRQIVNFGKGFVFSPIDAFSTVNALDLDFRRSGSDVVTVKIPIGNLSGVDLIGELPYGTSPFSVAAKGFTTIGSFDIGLVGLYRDPNGRDGAVRQGLAGVSFKGDVEVGLYGELVTHIIQDGRRAWAEAMLGVDYSIRNRWVLTAEYQYSDHGWTQRTWGEHNAFASAQFLINDLVSVSGNALYDFEHKRAFGTLMGTYSVAQNVNAELYVRGFTGFDAIPYDLSYGLRTAVQF